MLRMLSARSKKTWDGLKTWRGTLRRESVSWWSGDRARRFFEMSDPLEGRVRSTEFKQISHSSVTFAVDLEHDRVFSRPKTQSVVYVDLASDEPFSIDTERVRHTGADPVSIVTPDSLIRFDPEMPYRMPPGGTARVAFRYPLVRTAFDEEGVIVRTFETVYYSPAPEKRAQVGITDPREYLSLGRPTWLDLEMTAAALEQAGWPAVCGVSFQVRKVGAGAQEEYLVIRPGQVGPGECVIQEMTFPADADFNITLLVERDPQGPVRREKRWTYQQQEGLFIPHIIKTTSFDRQDGSVRSKSTVTLVESEVNKPISPETFTERNLGLQAGDHFVDKRAGRVFVYEGGTLKLLEGVSAETLDMMGGFAVPQE